MNFKTENVASHLVTLYFSGVTFIFETVFLKLHLQSILIRFTDIYVTSEILILCNTSKGTEKV